MTSDILKKQKAYKSLESSGFKVQDTDEPPLKPFVDKSVKAQADTTLDQKMVRYSIDIPLWLRTAVNVHSAQNQVKAKDLILSSLIIGLKENSVELPQEANDKVKLEPR